MEIYAYAYLFFWHVLSAGTLLWLAVVRRDRER